MCLSSLRTGLSIIIVLAGLTSLFSCASSYHSVRPESIRYNEPMESNLLDFGYMYNVLSHNGNKKYAKKEIKKGINLVAIRLTNNTGRDLSLRDDIQFIAGGHGVFPIDKEIIRKELKQGVPIYLLYSLIVVQTYRCTNFNCDISTYPVGVFISGLNMIIAGSANKKFSEELAHYDIMDRVLAPGETMYGLIGLQDMGYAPLTVKLK